VSRNAIPTDKLTLDPVKLMVDRELQALDMRHTLPNLKNFVLTVTHGEIAPTKYVRLGSVSTKF
jgi:hypothetical protein